MNFLIEPVREPRLLDQIPGYDQIITDLGEFNFGGTHLKSCFFSRQRSNQWKFWFR